MRLPTIAAAVLLAASTLGVLPTTTFAQSTAPVSSTAAHRAAPGPLVGAGPVGLVIAGVGYGVYWLVKRRRRAN